jgi:hypothetical protein
MCEEQEDQQQFMNQGKYSTLLSYSLKTTHYCMCLILLDYKDVLAIDDLHLDSYGFYCTWVEC